MCILIKTVYIDVDCDHLIKQHSGIGITRALSTENLVIHTQCSCAVINMTISLKREMSACKRGRICILQQIFTGPWCDGQWRITLHVTHTYHHQYSNLPHYPKIDKLNLRSAGTS